MKHTLLAASALTLAPLAVQPARAAALPENMGGGLRQLIAEHQAGAKTLTPLESTAIRDPAGRIMIKVYVAKGASYDAVRARVIAAGGTIDSELPSFHAGVMGVWAPVDRIASLATLAGVRSVTMVHIPNQNVGIVTSQGAGVLKTDQLNRMGFNGAGITVGALSNSYDTYTTYPAATDVSSGDLPGTGNPDKHIKPVVVVKEGPAGDDEGRGMLQIVHDLAPGAKLCFATAYSSDVAFAKDILALASKKGKCRADIIVDDVGYSDEPFFSDENPISAAVNQVAADGVIYFSSAGNGNQGSYNATFAPIPPATALTLTGQTVDLSTVPAALIAGGVHNFGTADKPVISQTVATSTLGGLSEDFAILQWNDPFNLSAITANYVILIFDSTGKYLPKDSGIDNAVKTDQPIQVGQLPFGSGSTTTYQIAIAKTTTTDSPATQLRWESFYQADSRQTTFNADHSPSIAGHPAAAGAIAVAADFYGATLGTEYFSSQGPFVNYFDSTGARLTTPEVRQKPEIAAVDGADSTFFPEGAGNDADGNGFPNFFGTSAAAPHAAGVAAVLLQKAGGKGKITPAQMRTILEGSAHPHSLSPGIVTGTAATFGGQKATVSVHGYIPIDPTQWQVTVSTKKGVSLTGLSFNGFASHSVFENPFIFGSSNNLAAGDITTNVAAVPSFGLSLKITPGKAVDGTTFTFSVDFDNAIPDYLGINANLLAGTSFTASFSDGTFTTQPTPLAPTSFGSGYSWDDGFGLIDAVAASALIGK